MTPGSIAAATIMSEPDFLDASFDASALPDPTESMLLVGQAQAGSREALDALLARYQDRLRRIVGIRLSSQLRRCMESMDVVQETYLAAFAHIGELEVRDPASILQWLSRIAQNRMLDAYRRHYGLKRDRSREVNVKAAHHERADHAEGAPPDERAAQREMEEIVDTAVGELPDEYREVIMLRTYYGGSWAYVAEQLGRPSEDAARQLYRRARIKLARIVNARVAPSEHPSPDGSDGDTAP